MVERTPRCFFYPIILSVYLPHFSGVDLGGGPGGPAWPLTSNFEAQIVATAATPLHHVGKISLPPPYINPGSAPAIANHFIGNQSMLKIITTSFFTEKSFFISRSCQFLTSKWKTRRWCWMPFACRLSRSLINTEIDLTSKHYQNRNNTWAQ